MHEEVSCPGLAVLLRNSTGVYEKALSAGWWTTVCGACYTIWPFNGFMPMPYHVLTLCPDSL